MIPMRITLLLNLMYAFMTKPTFKLQVYLIIMPECYCTVLMLCVLKPTYNFLKLLSWCLMLSYQSAEWQTDIARWLDVSFAVLLAAKGNCWPSVNAACTVWLKQSSLSWLMNAALKSLLISNFVSNVVWVYNVGVIVACLPVLLTVKWQTITTP